MQYDIKFHAGDIREIRSRVAAGETRRALAEEMGTKPSVISKIVNREIYDWVDDKPRRYLSKEERREIRRLSAAGFEVKELAEMFGTTEKAIRWAIG